MFVFFLNIQIPKLFFKYNLIKRGVICYRMEIFYLELERDRAIFDSRGNRNIVFKVFQNLIFRY